MTRAMIAVIIEDQEHAQEAFDLIEHTAYPKDRIAQQNYAARRYQICRWLMGMEQGEETIA